MRMEAGEDGSELIGQLAALMEQLTEGGGLEGIPQELVEAQRADRRRQKEIEDRRVAEAASAAANAPPERVWLDAVMPSISCLSCIDEMLHTGEDLCPRCRREGRTGGGDLPLVVKVAVLYQAADWNRREAISRILETGVDVDQVSAQDGDGRTALMVAASSGSLDACRELIGRGASAHAMDAEGLTPLLHACWGRSPGCVKELLESAGADPNQADFCGETPVMVAARLGDVESLNLLISHGCDLSLRDENDWDALGKAKARGGRAEIIDAIEGALRAAEEGTGDEEDAYDPDELD